MLKRKSNSIKYLQLAVISFVVIIFNSNNINAQDFTKRLEFGLFTNWADFNAPTQTFGKTMTDAYWQGTNPTSLKLLGSMHISKSFRLDLSAFTIVLEKMRMQQDFGITLTNNRMWGIDLDICYEFANDKLLKDDSWFSPYVCAGLGVDNIDTEFYLKTQAGIGIDFWLIHNFAVSIQSTYVLLPNYNNYIHYSVGVKFRPGFKKDSDSDGIADKNDNCPNIAGLKEFNGCPDSDGDGIVDHADKCPEEAGKYNLNGCPDGDGDGISDADDNCPNKAGESKNMGCPDTDGDGVIDKNDDCINLAGIIEYNGCPDTDGDGIRDIDDTCPNEKGDISNNGCPKVIKEIKENSCGLINNTTNVVYFKTAQKTLSNQAKQHLDSLAQLIVDCPETTVITVAGHTDSTGSEEFNYKLSIQRAKKVVDYFVSKGVSTGLITAEGLGETVPVGNNTTKEGQQLNRRVEILIITK